MKSVGRLWFVLLVIACLFVRCHKSNLNKDDVHIYSLLNKSLPQIKAEIAGRWQMKRLNYTICPFAGPCFEVDSIYTNNEGDLITFLNNDTIKRTSYTGMPVRFYEKANITRVKYNSAGDSVYVYRINTGSNQYLMQEIKNDSLVISNRGVYYYLTRKP